MALKAKLKFVSMLTLLVLAPLGDASNSLTIDQQACVIKLSSLDLFEKSTYADRPNCTYEIDNTAGPHALITFHGSLADVTVSQNNGDFIPVRSTGIDLLQTDIRGRVQLKTNSSNTFPPILLATQTPIDELSTQYISPTRRMPILSSDGYYPKFIDSIGTSLPEALPATQRLQIVDAMHMFGTFFYQNETKLNEYLKSHPINDPNDLKLEEYARLRFQNHTTYDFSSVVDSLAEHQHYLAFEVAIMAARGSARRYENLKAKHYMSIIDNAIQQSWATKSSRHSIQINRIEFLIAMNEGNYTRAQEISNYQADHIDLQPLFEQYRNQLELHTVMGNYSEVVNTIKDWINILETKEYKLAKASDEIAKKYLGWANEELYKTYVDSGDLINATRLRQTWVAPPSLDIQLIDLQYALLAGKGENTETKLNSIIERTKSAYKRIKYLIKAESLTSYSSKYISALETEYLAAATPSLITSIDYHLTAAKSYLNANELIKASQSIEWLEKNVPPKDVRSQVIIQLLKSKLVHNPDNRIQYALEGVDIATQWSLSNTGAIKLASDLALQREVFEHAITELLNNGRKIDALIVADNARSLNASQNIPVDINSSSFRAAANNRWLERSGATASTSANVSKPHNFSNLSYEHIQRLSQEMKEDAAIAEYFLGHQSSWLFVIDKNGVHAHSINAKYSAKDRNSTSVINAKIKQQLPTDLTQLNIDLGIALLGQYKSLTIVADAFLASFPFATVLEQPLSSSTSVAGLRKGETAPQSSSTLIYDPVYIDDDRAPENKEHFDPATAFARLNMSKFEADAILKSNTLKNPLLIDGYSANKSNYSDLPSSNYLHVSSHAQSDAIQPVNNGLVLSQIDREGNAIDWLLNIADIAQGPSFEHVVLSGCDTALGVVTTGDDIVGITQAFLNSGSKSVVSTLWPVQDKPTAVFMQYYYRALKDNSPAVALLIAQDKVKANPKWSHPYFWAGFKLTSIHI